MIIFLEIKPMKTTHDIYFWTPWLNDLKIVEEMECGDWTYDNLIFYLDLWISNAPLDPSKIIMKIDWTKVFAIGIYDSVIVIEFIMS